MFHLTTAETEMLQKKGVRPKEGPRQPEEPSQGGPKAQTISLLQGSLPRLPQQTSAWRSRTGLCPEVSWIKNVLI